MISSIFTFVKQLFSSNFLYICLISLTMMLTNNSKAQTSIYVGGVGTINAPNAPQGTIDACTWSTTDSHIGVSGDKYSAQVKVNSYFSGTAKVQCYYSYTYWDSYINRKVVSSGTTYYYVSCKASKIKLNKSEVTIEVGDEIELSYSTEPSGLEPIVEWKTSDKNVAVIDDDDSDIWKTKVIIRGKSAGTSTITCNGNTGDVVPKCVIHVTDDRPHVTANVESGIVQKGTMVTFTCDRAGADIRYTTDESEPNKNSTKYTGPIKIEKSIKFKVKAYADGKESKVKSFEYKVYAHLPDEVFTYKTKEGAVLTIKAFKHSTSDTRLQIGTGTEAAIDKKYKGCVTIPDGIDGMLVDIIAEKAFYGSEITEVKLPESNWNLSIQASAFKQCKNLTKVVIPKYLRWINSEAFSDCTALETLVFLGWTNFKTSRSLKKNNAEKVFYNCNKIRSIYLCSSDFSEINDNLFDSEVYNNAILYVPLKMTSTFKYMAGWKKFKNIVEFDTDNFDPNNITILVSEIKLDNTSIKLNLNQKLQLNADVLPENATNKNVTWSSDNTKVATVSNTGLVEALSKGSATITCSANDGGGAKAICEVTVNDDVPNYTYFTAKTTEGVEMQFYALEKGKCCVKGNGSKAIDINTTGPITIPEEVAGRKVVVIRGSTFDGCKGITKIKIPKSVEEIESYAFYNCI